VEQLVTVIYGIKSALGDNRPNPEPRVYALEDRDPSCILGFAAASALGSANGLLESAWPLGVAEAIWAGVAFRTWWKRSNMKTGDADVA